MDAMKLILRTFIVCALFFPLLCFAYTEDICIYKQAPYIRNCLPLPKECLNGNLVVKNESLYKKCQKLAVQVTNITDQDERNKKIIAVRSMLHADSTYFLASLLGFSAESAYAIAKYDQAADVVRFIPFTNDGRQLLSTAMLENCQKSSKTFANNKYCRLTTRDVDGVSRVNVGTGGSFFHYPSQLTAFEVHTNWDPKNPPQYIDPLGLYLKSFNFGSFSNAYDVDIAGIGESPNKKQVYLSIPDTIYNKIVKLPLRGQVVHQGDNGQEVMFNQLSKYVYPDSPSLAAYGMYLHHYQDLYSHHICFEHSTLTKISENEYRVNYSPFCASNYHFLWHIWEVGANQESMPVIHQTVLAGLNATYSSLLEYLRLHSLPDNSKQINREMVIKDLVSVLSIESVEDRLSEMEKLYDKYHILSLSKFMMNAAASSATKLQN